MKGLVLTCLLLAQSALSAQSMLMTLGVGAIPHTSGGGGSVAVDAVGPSSAGTNALSGSSTWTTFTLTWTHACGATATALVVGAIFTPNSSSTATVTATFNGVSMTQAGTVNADNTSAQGSVWMFTLGSCSGSHSVVVTATYASGTKANNDLLAGGSISFTGSTGFGTAVTAFGSGTSASVAVSSATGHVVVDSLGAGTSATTTQTSRWKNTNTQGDTLNVAAGSTAAGSSSVTMGYTIGTDVWGIIGVDVQ